MSLKGDYAVDYSVPHESNQHSIQFRDSYLWSGIKKDSRADESSRKGLKELACSLKRP
jgi:hypothetical protein